MGNSLYQYLDDGLSFLSTKAREIRTLYFPLCSTASDKIKSSITPYLSGDIKIDKNHYVTKPVSIEDLRNPTRNFFLKVAGRGIFSLSSLNQDNRSVLQAGPLWQNLKVENSALGISLGFLNFVPVSGENVEVMKVTVTNITDYPLTITPTAVIPLFARALANKHDHEHVTSLLNRLKQTDHGVLVEPSMLFNEEGHKEAEGVYFCLGTDDAQEPLEGTFPTMMSYCGEAGTLDAPQAVWEDRAPKALSDQELQGREAVGALRFKTVEISPRANKEFYIVAGMATDASEVLKIFNLFNSGKKVDKALKANQEFWVNKSRSILFNAGDARYNSWIHWVELQPVLRRIYGCSFLPDHDYGKGGKGWRDIWQDLLSLILIEPTEVRETLINNFAGVRIDGSNATIIGSKPGEFVADRNAITRVWMDHGVWPLATLFLYIHQTGDYDILLEHNTYFRDPQLSRTFRKDPEWSSVYGNQLKDSRGNVVTGSLIEHILIENLVPFFNVGEHNIIRLESADWNDGLDMAFDHGESVAFMSLYGGNLSDLANMLEDLARIKAIGKIEIASEVLILLDSLGKDAVDYDHISQKRSRLFDTYFNAVEPEISGETREIDIQDIVRDLRLKAEWVFAHIQRQEKITVKDQGQTYTWFNGYYDNNRQPVEGVVEGRPRITLTGQVFPLMSGLARDADVVEVIKTVNAYLKDKDLGGIRLNSDFGLKHYLALGRAFGFAYGTKENGAFFSHMIVMYAYALYKRGFAREGFTVLDSLYRMSIDTEKSKIFPGIPEYFDSEGRGKYHYLTGSASWYIYTILTQVFGVRGHCGNLLIAPQLMKEQFAESKTVDVTCQFAGKKVSIYYQNPQVLDFGDYSITEVFLNEKPVVYEPVSPAQICIERKIIEKAKGPVKISIGLGRD